MLGIGQHRTPIFAYTAAEAAASILNYGNFPELWAVAVGLREIVPEPHPLQHHQPSLVMALQ